MIKYKNGNIFVRLYEDGTKFRYCSGEPAPEFPESIDLKITDSCEMGCTWCYENSTPEGKHGDANAIIRMAQHLHPGTEVAIGGGNALSHPEIKRILQELNTLGLVVSTTTHYDHRDMLDGLFRFITGGIGVSCAPAKLKWQNVVHHMIAGVDSVHDVPKFGKVLVLGYKNCGRGKQPPQSVHDNVGEWVRYIGFYLGEPEISVSFDNLAIKQLGVRQMFGNPMWEKLYMGDDGQYSLYVDGVQQMYAKNSTAIRYDRWDSYENVIDYYKAMRGNL